MKLNVSNNSTSPHKKRNQTTDKNKKWHRGKVLNTRGKGHHEFFELLEHNPAT